jgi:hypothetical protein
VYLTGSHVNNNFHDGSGPGAECSETPEPNDFRAYFGFLSSSAATTSSGCGAWTRLLSVPLVFLPIWTRSWREGAIVVVWLIANPIMFREPKNDKTWVTRAMLEEEMWIAKRPLDRAMALSVGATAFGLGGVWGAYKRRLLPTALCTVGQVGLLLAYWREMAIYYERHRGKGE